MKKPPFKWSGIRAVSLFVGLLAVNIALILAGDPTVTGPGDYLHKLVTKGPRVLLGIILVSCIGFAAAIWFYCLRERWRKSRTARKAD